jgi:hypothetical protein
MSGTSIAGEQKLIEGRRSKPSGHATIRRSYPMISGWSMM